MFLLHEDTKTRLCRGAFVALCVIPTCFVLTWTVAVNLPSYTRAHQRAIASHLGVIVELARASTPRPGITLYESLELSDPDTGQPIARLPFVEVDSNADAIAVRLPYPGVVNGTHLDAFWTVAQELFRGTAASHRIDISAGNLTLHLPEGDQSLTDLMVEIESNSKQTRLQVQFSRALAGANTSPPCELKIVRSRDAAPAVLVQFSTGPAPLPCSLAVGLFPSVSKLGNSCEFQGDITAAITDRDWQLQCAGQLKKVDLDLLVSGQLPHKLSGWANVELEQLTLHNGRMEAAAGVISAGPGTVGTSLVHAAESHLHVPAGQLRDAPSDIVKYDRLAVGFAVNTHGLMMRGELPRSPGAIMVDMDDRPVLLEPTVLVQPVVNLARTLVSESQVQVPATRETAALIRALPVPSIVPPVDGREPFRQARSLRLVPKKQH